MARRADYIEYPQIYGSLCFSQDPPILVIVVERGEPERWKIQGEKR